VKYMLTTLKKQNLSISVNGDILSSQVYWQNRRSQQLFNDKVNVSKNHIEKNLSDLTLALYLHYLLEKSVIVIIGV
jgi:hypothetical protein